MEPKSIQELSSTGRHQECLQSCQQLLQGDPESPVAWKYAGKSLLALGQFEKAQQCLTKAHQLDPSDPEIAKDIGNSFLNLGNKDAAAQWYERSLGVNNNYSPAINNLANLKRQGGNNQEAFDLFKRAIQVDPQLIQAYAGAAASLIALSDLDQAEAFATQAIEINAHAPGINEMRGIIFQNKKNSQQAVESYQKELAINPQSNTSLLNLGLLLLQQGEASAAIEPLTAAAAFNHSEQCSLLLAQAYQNIGKLKEAIAEYKRLDISTSQNKMIPFNLGLCLLNTGSNIDAIEAFKIAIKMDESFLPAWGNIGTALINEGRHHEALPVTQKFLEHNPDNPTAHMNLGGIYKDLGNLDKALASTLKSLELKPDNPDAHINLGGIYKDLGNLDKALASTLKSLELRPDNPNALMNLGGIYKKLGNLDQALASTLKSLELNPDNHGAFKNVQALIDQLNISPSNVNNILRAYELLLNQTNASHRELSKIFLQAYLPIIQKASASDPIISDNNEALNSLAADKRFRKSLILMIPPCSEAEGFFTRLREELLNLTIQEGTIPEQLKPLTESLAAQCFLNEYVYSSSQLEDDSIVNLIDAAVYSQQATNRYLAIIGCYKAIHTTGISPEFINNYPTPDDGSKELITAQFKEPLLEQEIKTSLQEKRNVSNTISQQVQAMYEENPYPRFKFSNYTASELAKPVFNSIKLETTRRNQSFQEKLISLSARPKVLIAGCGTGNQVIGASRYKNAQITAIDLSSNSIAYAIRKTKEYGMDNVTFKKMDLLNVADLGEIFDIIACSGVLHHMDNPSEGLLALIQQLEPGGYIKLALYSEIARKDIVEARKTIQMLEIDSTPKSIKAFRKKVLDGKIQELLDLPKFFKDFYSLSECRDLCFHVQEHRFTTEKLQKLLDSHDLTFCGFMVPEQIKKLYQEQYPEDRDMTSLSNWGKFEEEHPSTFASMYQFWAQKTS